MSLKNKLILSTFLISGFLFLTTVLIFVVLSLYHINEHISKIHTEVIRTFTYIQKILGKNSNEVFFDLGNCGISKKGNYILLREEGLYIGRVANCRFYGTHFTNGIEFTAEVNDLSWFIAYDRAALERFAENKPGFFDNFIRDRLVLKDLILEGKYLPNVIKDIKNITGYKIVDTYKRLVMDFPVLIEGSVPIGRVVFIKDLTPILKELLFTPLIFFVYTVILVVTLSVVLLLLFNKIIKDILYLRKVTTKFKESDFSEIPLMTEKLRREKTRDELFYLKRSVLTMAQELEALITQLQSEKDRLEELAYSDPLTGLSNRRFFLEETKRAIEYARRYGEPASVLMLDIDNFKLINDEYGHDVGDIALKKLAEVIKRNIRGSDIAARFGGEEFVVFLPRTDERGAELVAERIRRDFKKDPIKVDNREVLTTVSIGVAELDREDDIEDLIKKADTALYRAKKTGKDKVIRFSSIEENPRQG